MRNLIHNIALTLVIIGALNWGLIGVANINLVTSLFGALPGISQIIYMLVGLSGLYLALSRFILVKA